MHLMFPGADELDLISNFRIDAIEAHFIPLIQQHKRMNLLVCEIVRLWVAVKHEAKSLPAREIPITTDN